MPIYKVQAPDGRIMRIQADTPPSQAIVEEFYKSLPPIEQTQQVTQAPQVQEDSMTLREKIALGAKVAPLATIPLKGPLAPVGSLITGGSRFVEGLAEDESIGQAAKAGLKSGVIDLATLGLGKAIKSGLAARKAAKAKKGVSQVDFETAQDVLKRNKEFFSGSKKIKTSNLSDPRYVNAVGDQTSKTISTLEKTIRSKQQNAVKDGVILGKAQKKLYKNLSEIDLEPDVSSPKTYNTILDVLSDPNLTTSKLYDARKLADQAINYTEAKVFQKPYIKIRRNIDQLLRDPMINTKAKEYGKETDNLKTILENRVVKNLIKRTDEQTGLGKFGEGFMSSGAANQKSFKKVINKLKLDPGVQEKLRKDILEGAKSLETAKAFKDIKPPLLLRKTPFIGDVIGEAYKSTLPTQQKLGEILPGVARKALSRAATPIEREESGGIAPRTLQQIKKERGL